MTRNGNITSSPLRRGTWYVPVAKQLPFTTNGAADFHTIAEQSSPLRRGAAKRRGGLSPEALAKDDTSNSLVIAKERETLKTLSYDCGNPGIICLRANARSAFLFTGSPRSFHSLAMTKVTKCRHHTFVIPAPGVPANTNVFVGWIRREFYIISAIIFVIHFCHSRVGGNRVY